MEARQRDVTRYEGTEPGQRLRGQRSTSAAAAGPGAAAAGRGRGPGRAALQVPSGGAGPAGSRRGRGGARRREGRRSEGRRGDAGDRLGGGGGRRGGRGARRQPCGRAAGAVLAEAVRLPAEAIGQGPPARLPQPLVRLRPPPLLPLLLQGAAGGAAPRAPRHRLRLLQLPPARGRRCRWGRGGRLRGAQPRRRRRRAQGRPRGAVRGSPGPARPGPSASRCWPRFVVVRERSNPSPTRGWLEVSGCASCLLHFCLSEEFLKCPTERGGDCLRWARGWLARAGSVETSRWRSDCQGNLVGCGFGGFRWRFSLLGCLFWKHRWQNLNLVCFGRKEEEGELFPHSRRGCGSCCLQGRRPSKDETKHQGCFYTSFLCRHGWVGGGTKKPFPLDKVGIN